ncbi:hypothetical protein IC229_05685 [Spirosoma sp. BT702]|uniref:Uncharacterized protein n=1 Tax=Spirosoma profusum TaxID=2771354 RepID=A0A926Y1I4_9BACT|nr:hypothetical protein [Spirosoma profusum]MBD2700116.1 hypothetical protein [Spirosoma profusum]
MKNPTLLAHFAHKIGGLPTLLWWLAALLLLLMLLDPRPPRRYRMHCMEWLMINLGTLYTTIRKRKRI